VDFAVLDVAGFEGTAAYDVIFTLDAIHDQAQPAHVLKNIYQSLKPDGVYLMQDIAGSSYVENNIDHPMAPFLYTISCTHCMSVSLANEGVGLGAMWGEELAESMVKEAGFTRFENRQLDHDPMNNYYIIRK
jgi:2-polyprenyl-3-methyl-5-hydroxy-6-metoxy-1,4-benzoquinol methylase